MATERQAPTVMVRVRRKATEKYAEEAKQKGAMTEPSKTPNIEVR